MNTNEEEKENIKLTVIDDKEAGDKNYFEIKVNRNFLNTAYLSLLLRKNAMPDLSTRFTNREKEVLMYMAEGDNNKEIAKKMNISIHTSKIHISNIFQKIGAKDRTEAVVKAIKYNILNIFSEGIEK